MKIVTVVGARPQFVKAAVLRKVFLDAGVDELLIHTGQHYDHNMSTSFFEEMNMKQSDYKCELEHRSHGAMTGEILASVETILQKEKPDYCLVYGDTNSTMAGALSAAKLHIPVCHVEAGLRSFNKNMPEEINRIVTDHVSDLLFCSTSTSVANLVNENITNGVHHVGDIMYDAVKMFTSNENNEQLVNQYIKRDARKLACLTIHRQESLNTRAELAERLDYCNSFSDEYQVVFPVHPGTAKKILEYELSTTGLTMIEPLPYSAMQALMSVSNLVLTDSGGLQKEAYFNQTRCITLRDETEWVETISSGWNRLWKDESYACEPQPISEYGDGDTGKRILEVLENHHANRS